MGNTNGADKGFNIKVLNRCAGGWCTWAGYKCSNLDKAFFIDKVG